MISFFLASRAQLTQLTGDQSVAPELFQSPSGFIPCWRACQGDPPLNLSEPLFTNTPSGGNCISSGAGLLVVYKDAGKAQAIAHLSLDFKEAIDFKRKEIF